jgi:malonate-semialdehyde dehydrogenase (acetylating)/methylmalonate-semialdehyde dehydrogenase
MVGNWVNGRPADTEGRDTGEVFNPATGRLAARVVLSSLTEANAVIDAAHGAFASWKDSSLASRARIMFRFRELADARKNELAEVVTAEHGKVLTDALAEVNRGLEVVEFACGLPHLLKGDHSENASTKVDVYSMRQPLGVAAIISPFNFPTMVPMWFFPLAIAAGNTVVLKPSEKTPSAALLLAEIWRDAGLPEGVFNVLQGDKTAVDAILSHPRVKSVSFVGSTPIAKYVYETGTAYGKRVQALGGAKNHMVVLPDADLDLAADAAVNAGYGSAGERCMAVSVVVAVGGTADVLTQKIAERAAAIVTGDGARPDTDMGPLITGAHRDKVRSYIESGVETGADLVVDGRDVLPVGSQDGFYVGPTLFDNVRTDQRIYREEIFGPVLSVIRVESYDDAINLVNANEFANGAVIFTNDGGAARRFQHEVDAGMVGINVPVPVPVSYYSFGGSKESLFGDSHAHGMDGIHFFTRGKVVTTRWLDPSHGGINLGFPGND